MINKEIIKKKAPALYVPHNSDNGSVLPSA